MFADTRPQRRKWCRMTSETRWLTVTQTAAILGVTPQQIRKLIQAGTLKAWRIPPYGRHRLDPAQVEAMRKQATPGAL